MYQSESSQETKLHGDLYIFILYTYIIYKLIYVIYKEFSVRVDSLLRGAENPKEYRNKQPWLV